MEVVVQPYISVDIKPECVENLCAKLSRVLSQLGVDAERSAADLHVSLAYVLGTCEKSTLAQIAKKLAEHKLEAKVCGVEILEGQTTGYDYVALSFESNNEFATCSKEISQELATREFQGGFRTHLTLFRMKKGAIRKETLSSVCSSLTKNCERSTVSAKAISVFDSNYKKQLTVAI